LPELRRIAAAALTAVTVSAAAVVPSGVVAQVNVNPLEIEDLILEGRPAEAAHAAQDALARLRSSSEPVSYGLAGRILVALCEARNDLKEYDLAEAICLEAVATLEAAEATEPGARWVLTEKALPQLALTYDLTHQPEKALDIHERELQRAGADPGRRITILSSIGELQQSLGRWRDAEASFREALDSIGSVPRSEREATYLAYGRLSLLYRTEERFDEAENLLSEGIDALRADFGGDSAYLLVLTEALGWTCYEKGQLERSRDIAAKLIDTYQRSGRGDSLLTVSTRLLLARAEDDLSPGSAEAERALALALATSQGTVRVGEYLHAFARSELARHYLLTANFAEAETLARGAAAYFTEEHGKTHGLTALTTLLLARALHGLGRDAEAAGAAQVAYAAQWAYLPPYHSELGETLSLLSELYEALGDSGNLRATQAYLDDHRAARKQFESGN
jgi:hypothetical protein